MNRFELKVKPLMIAHAAGGFHGQNYTNSLDALNRNYAQGYRFFEMDFSWTSDQQLVCLHDWGKTFTKLFNLKVKSALRYSEIVQLIASKDDFEICTASSLADWLKNKPEVKIITDIKYDNLRGIAYLLAHYPDLQSHLIPQFYQPEEYQALRDMGFKQLIWILYQYKGNKKSIVAHSQHMELLALSMRASQAKSKTLQLLVPNHQVFVYTINNEKDKLSLVNDFHVTGIYTDFLPHELSTVTDCC